MIFTGLKNDEEWLEEPVESELDRDVKEYRNFVDSLGVETGEHIANFLLGEEGWVHTVSVHFNKDMNVVDLAGSDDRPDGLALEVQEYLEKKGYDYDTFMEDSYTVRDRINKAWREQFPKEAAESDERKRLQEQARHSHSTPSTRDLTDW